MSAIELTGKMVGKWTVLKKHGSKWLCRCECGTERIIGPHYLTENKIQKCRKCWLKDHSRDLSGKQFGKWTVLSRHKKNTWLCKCECGSEVIVNRSILFYGAGNGCRDCWRIANEAEDLTGKIFGKWTVLKKDDNCDKKFTYWICKCYCGIEKSIYNSHLTTGQSTSCRICSNHKHKGKLSGSLWNRLKYSAKNRNINVEFGYSEEEAKQFLYDLLYKKQQCRCALSGLPIGIANTSYGDRHGETTASLDRIDSNKDYTRGNVQWVHKWVNFMKQDLDQDKFITLCEIISQYKRS